VSARHQVKRLDRPFDELRRSTENRSGRRNWFFFVRCGSLELRNFTGPPSPDEIWSWRVRRRPRSQGRCIGCLVLSIFPILHLHQHRVANAVPWSWRRCSASPGHETAGMVIASRRSQA